MKTLQRLFFWKKGGQKVKHTKLEAAVIRNKQAQEDTRQLTKELLRATLNGDDNWFVCKGDN